MICKLFHNPNTGKIHLKTWIKKAINNIFDRLYTGDPGTAFSEPILRGTGIYKDVLENNVDLERSFSSDLMVENTIADPKSALYFDSDFVIQDCKVKINLLFHHHILIIF